MKCSVEARIRYFVRIYKEDKKKTIPKYF